MGWTDRINRRRRKEFLTARNTAFFHSQATQRRRRNFIHKLQDEEGRETEIRQEMEGIVRSYFQNLFTLETRGNYNHLLSGIDRGTSEEDNQRLTMLYTKKEIREAVFEMGPTKAPGEDLFPALFYQNCRHIIGDDVTNFFLQILNRGMEVKQINSTHIHFQPISLCNVIYKILAKAIVNRLREVIEKCIDMAQSAFVPDRLISDNVLLAYEILHTLKQKRLGKKGFITVKLDMSKVYDRVEWNFIKEIMVQIGFAINNGTISYSIVEKTFDQQGDFDKETR
ncbi:reverse transcriptase [Gossypium australe]|uniref:Reverse transcriptase n=1 Tax=Gossypium australe TaxID=47621 RepID=A0A5B6WHQ4_9ROSI|nr:reverse transcriptase [Gossypium australe]